MPIGTGKWFDARKGYGFIAPDVGGKGMFVHITVVRTAGLERFKETSGRPSKRGATGGTRQALR